MRILALVPGGIGDQVYFFPTLETLHSKYDGAKIDVLVEPRAKKAYRVCKYVSEVLQFDYQDRNSMADYLNLLGVIRDREYEAVLSYNAPWAVEALLWLNGIPLRIGEANSNKLFFTSSLALDRTLYQAETFHSLLPGLGVATKCPDVKINVPQKDIDWAVARKQLLDLNDGYILLDGTPDTYPVASWHKIVQDIQTKQPGLPIVLLQNEEIDPWIDEMMDSKLVVKVVAPSDVGKISAIIAGANLLVSSDRDSIALAVAVGTYTIALLGSDATTTKLLPSDDNYTGISAASGKVTDITPETILNRIWGS